MLRCRRVDGRPATVPARVVAVVVAVGALLVALPPLGAAGAAPGAAQLSLRLETMTPRIVTPDGPEVLTLTGELGNTGERPVRGVELRVQRGPALSADRDLRSALAGTAPADSVTPAFVDLATVLDPGQVVPVQLRIPLRGPAAGSLALTEPGTYPLLVNVNGVPDFGGRARLAATRLLLPVLGLPAAPGAPPVGTVPAAGIRVGLLYPLVDVPRQLPTGPGQPPLLSDDELGASLAPGGRLFGLVRALAQGAPPGSALAGEVCLAVDPDLLATAAAMAGGYAVRTPGGVVEGRGALAAAQWLDGLRAVARGRCVLALPYADADLVVLSRANLTDLIGYSRTVGARVVTDVLGTPPLTDATWPVDGTLDERTLADVLAGGEHTLVLASDTLTEAVVPPGGAARLAGIGDPVALVTDPLLSTALDAPTEDTALAAPVGPRVAAAPSTSPAGSDAPLAAQDALGALLYRATVGASADPGRTRVVLAGPPRRWRLDAAEAGALLDGIRRLTDAGLAGPADVAALVGGTPTGGPAVSLSYPLLASARELPIPVSTAARVVRDRQRDLFAATEQDRVGALPPSALFEPIDADLLRAVSAAWRPEPSRAVAAVAAVADRVDTLRSLVTVVQPSGPYTLGSNESPLLITVQNQLPVAVTVHVALSRTPGLATGDVPLLRVPAQGRIQVRVSAEVSRSGQFSVDARATTPSGAPLGPTSRLLLRSTAYGTITVWLTASAGVVLVLLAGLRIIRRLRGRPSRDGRPPGGGGRTVGPTGPGGAAGTAAPVPTVPSGTR